MAEPVPSPKADAPVEDEDAPIVPPWLRTYNRIISRKPTVAPYVGPSACTVCCTFFSIFGALFLFSVAGLMRSNYRYLHFVPAAGEDMPTNSQSVTYAGFIYLIIGLYSMCYWSKGNIAKRDAVLSMQTH